MDDGVEARRGRWRGGSAWTLGVDDGVGLGVDVGVGSRRGRWRGGWALMLAWRIRVDVVWTMYVGVAKGIC